MVTYALNITWVLTRPYCCFRCAILCNIATLCKELHLIEESLPEELIHKNEGVREDQTVHY